MGKWDASLYTEKILPAALRDKMWQPGKTNKGELIGYGLGWAMGVHRMKTRQNHSGQTNGFTCVYHRFTGLHYSVFAFTNTYAGDVFAPAGLAMNHFAPELNYLSLKIPNDSNPDATVRSLKALRQAAFAEDDMTLLSAGMKDFATKPQFAATREEIKGFIDKSKSFRYIRRTMRGETEELFYRHDYEGGEVFWTLRFANGKLTSMNWEIE
jgi:hypothetical protein